jgi:hypothetical protein
MLVGPTVDACNNKFQMCIWYPWQTKFERPNLPASDFTEGASADFAVAAADEIQIQAVQIKLRASAASRHAEINMPMRCKVIACSRTLISI